MLIENKHSRIFSISLWILIFPYLIQSKEVGTPCRDIQWSDENCVVGPLSINTDLAEIVFRQLCPQLRGKFPSPNSCDFYIICNNNSLTLNRCPVSTHFNFTQEKCVNETKECLSVKDKIPNFDSLLQLNNLLHSQEKEGERRQKREIEECSNDSIEPDPKYCNKFIKCSNGKKTVQVCGPGTNFDPISKVCDFKSKVNCQSRLTDFGTYGCDIGKDYLTTHPEDCTKFVQCENGKFYIKNCGPGTLFNGEISACDHSSQVECKKQISLEHDIDVNNHPRIKRSPHFPNKNPYGLYCSERNYIAPHPAFCNKFVECEQGRLFTKSCGPGTVYNPRIAQCDWPYNTRRQIPNSCHHFEECRYGAYKLESCHGGTTYDPNTMSCSRSYKCFVTTTTESTTESTTTTTESTTTTTTPDYPDSIEIVSA